MRLPLPGDQAIRNPITCRGPLRARSDRTRAAVLPAALLLLGMIASWGMACAGHRTEAEGLEIYRRGIVTELRRVLPEPASRRTSSADRLRVTLEPRGGGAGTFNYHVVHVVAVGDFTEASAREFALVARRRPHAGVKAGTVRIYSDAGDARRLVASYGLDHTVALKQLISPRLPAPERGLPNRVDVSLKAVELVDQYAISVVAPFSRPEADALAAWIRERGASLPGDNRFQVKLVSNSGGPWVEMARFEFGP